MSYLRVEALFLKYFLIIFLFTFPIQKIIYLPFFGYKIQFSEIIFFLGLTVLIVNRNFLDWLLNHKPNLIDKSVLIWSLVALINLIINWNPTTLLEFIGQFYMVLVYTVIKYFLLNTNKTQLFETIFNLAIIIFYGICVSLICISLLYYTGLVSRSPFLYCADYPYFGEVYRLKSLTNEPVMLVSFLSLPFIIIAGLAMKKKSKKWILHFIIASFLLILALGKSLPIILAVVLIFIVLHFYKTVYAKVSVILLSILLVSFSVFFSNFHIKNTNSPSDKDFEKIPYIDPVKVFSFSNYEVYGNWYWTQKLNGVKIFKLAPIFGVGGGNMINVIKKERKYLDFTNKFSASDPLCTYTGVMGEYGLIGFLGLLILFGSIYFCFTVGFNKPYELKIFMAAFTYLLLEGLCTDIMNFKHLWVVMAIVSTIISFNTDGEIARVEKDSSRN